MFGLEVLVAIGVVLLFTIISVGVADSSESPLTINKDKGLYEIIFGNKPTNPDSRRSGVGTDSYVGIPKPGEYSDSTNDHRYSGAGLDQQIQDGPIDDAARLLGVIFQKYKTDDDKTKEPRPKFEPAPVDWPTYVPPTEPTPEPEPTPIEPEPTPVEPEPTPTYSPIGSIDISDLLKIEKGAFDIKGGNGTGGTGQGGSSSSYSAVLNALYVVAANYQENGNKIPTWLSDSITYIDSADRKNDGQKKPIIAIYYNEAGGQQINAPVEVGGNGLNVGSQLAESTGTNTVPLINNKNTALNSTSRGDITNTPGKDGSETTPVYIGHSTGVNLKNEKN